MTTGRVGEWARSSCWLSAEAAAAAVAPFAVVEATDTRAIRIVRRLRQSPGGRRLRVEVC